MRSIIQGDAGCVEADNRFGYIPKKGDCIFNNFEFTSVLKFDETGSVMPSENGRNKLQNLIIVGDSMAMGWRHSYNQTFSYLLSSFGYNVTNLSMSSYGTEQEVLTAINHPNFEEADTIIIQYCANDLEKNKKQLKDYIEDEATYYGTVTKLNLAFNKNWLTLHKS